MVRNQETEMAFHLTKMIAIGLTLFCYAASGAEKDRKLKSSKFEEAAVFERSLPPLLEGLTNAKDLKLYEGLPGRGPGSQLAKERTEKKTTKLHGFDFYLPPLEPQAEAAEEIDRLARDAASYSVFRPKFCGGFHPDWALEWTEGKSRYRLLICFGCYEAQLFGPKDELWMDVKKEAFTRFETLLKKHRKQLPEKIDAE